MEGASGDHMRLDIHLHPIGTSNDSDKCDFEQRFWHDFYNGGQWENNILKHLKEMKKYVSKLILH